jgi:lambda repressor-like predicted transcriptional regulator
MKTEEIKYELWKRRRQISMASIGREVGVTRAAVLHVVERKINSPRIAKAVANAIERPIDEVFPELAERRVAACN